MLLLRISPSWQLSVLVRLIGPISNADAKIERDENISSAADEHERAGGRAAIILLRAEGKRPTYPRISKFAA